MSEREPTRKEAQLSACHECMGYWSDGKVDCENVKCRFYRWMPYRKLEPDYSWMKYNPARAGLVTWEESKNDITDEERELRSQRMRDNVEIRKEKKKKAKNKRKAAK